MVKGDRTSTKNPIAPPPINQKTRMVRGLNNLQSKYSIRVCYFRIRPSYRTIAVNQVVTLELRDELYVALNQQAESVGISLAEWIAVALEQQSILLILKTDAEKEVARQRFRRHAGSIDLGYPTGADNVSIDADLVRAYDGDFN